MSVREQIQGIIAKHGITITSVFVPFSQSRSKSDKQPSLNWTVTLREGGREVLSTDYMAGYGHGPSYKQGRMSVDEYAVIQRECEYGVHKQHLTNKPILPDSVDVLMSLVSEMDVLNHSSFEDWADSTGYDTDSRKAEATYRTCLEIAIKLRNGLGEECLRELTALASDW